MKNYSGLDRDLNPGPRAPEARIIPLDHRAYAQLWQIKHYRSETDTRDVLNSQKRQKHTGLVRDLNPGPLAP